MSESSVRSLVKSVTWRLLGSMSTATITWGITGQISFAVEVGLAQLIINFILYLVHERIWNLSSWQRDDK